MGSANPPETKEVEVVDDPIDWPKYHSEIITACNADIDRRGVQAFACDFFPSQRPLLVPSDSEYLTLEINTALPSSISCQFGDKEPSDLKWQPGDILIYPNSESSRWTWEDRHSTCVFFLPYSRLRQVIMEGRDVTYRHPVLVPGITRDDTRLRNLLLMIAHEMDDRRSNGPHYAASLVDATMIHLAKNYVTENEAFLESQHLLSTAQLEKIRSFVSDNLDESIGVPDLAEAAGVKLSEFPRVFRATTGTTPYQYVLRERIDWSAELLRTTDLSLAEISYIAGFSSQSHFTRIFRKQNDVTPLAYRESFK